MTEAGAEGERLARVSVRPLANSNSTSSQIAEYLSIKSEMAAEHGPDEADPGEDWRGEW